MNQLPYRPNVCMLVFNRDAKLLLGQREGDASVWQFPQGGVEEGLGLEENVKKELLEELGIAATKLGSILKLQATHRYDFRKIPEYARGKFRGQDQTFWLVEFLGEDSDIRLDLHTPEFQDWCWCSLEELRKIADPLRIPGYEAALKEFIEHMSARVDKAPR